MLEDPSSEYCRNDGAGERDGPPYAADGAFSSTSIESVLKLRATSSARGRLGLANDAGYGLRR